MACGHVPARCWWTRWQCPLTVIVHEVVAVMPTGRAEEPALAAVLRFLQCPVSAVFSAAVLVVLLPQFSHHFCEMTHLHLLLLCKVIVRETKSFNKRQVYQSAHTTKRSKKTQSIKQDNKLFHLKM